MDCSTQLPTGASTQQTARVEVNIEPGEDPFANALE